MKNNLTSDPSPLRQTNLVYKFSCSLPHSKAEDYIGMTQTTLSRRLTMHTQTGSIYQHFISEHHAKPTRAQLTENTTIIARADNRYKLAIKEALLILNHAPTINKQFDNFTNILKVHNCRNNNQYQPNNNQLIHRPVETTSRTLPPSAIHDPKVDSLPNEILTLSPQTCLTHPTSPQNLNNELSPLLPTKSLSPPEPSANLLYSSSAHANTSNPQNINFSDTIVDMDTVLQRFGIDANYLNPVPLKQYKWNNFQILPPVPERPVDLDYSTNHDSLDPKSPTISQRIKGLLRGARKEYTADTAHQPQNKKTEILTLDSSIYRPTRTKRLRSQQQNERQTNQQSNGH